MTVSTIVWSPLFPLYWNTMRGDRMRDSAVVVTGLQGLPSLFRKSKTALSNDWFVQCNMRVCVLLHIHTNRVFMCVRMNYYRCFSSSQVSPAELKATEQSVRKHCPSFSEQTLDHPIALLWGNPNQAITTKPESCCTKMLEDQEASKAKQTLPAPLRRDREKREDVFSNRRRDKVFTHPCPLLLTLVLVYTANINRLS